MNKSFQEIYRNLEKCTEKLQDEVRASSNEMSILFQTLDESKIALNKAKDYHYNEILNQLNKIKVNIDTIAYHDKQIQTLQCKISDANFDRTSKIDKNYIKRQVEAFDSNNSRNPEVIIHRNKKQSYRDSMESMKYLDTWSKYVEKHDLLDGVSDKEKVVVNRRQSENSIRKKKKLISSTMDGFLEPMASVCLDTVSEEQFRLKEEENEENLTDDNSSESNNDGDSEAFNEEENSKPKIVEFIYKKKKDEE